MQYFSLSTNVNELRIGNNSSKNIGKEIGKFVVSTMEIPWSIIKNELGKSPEKLINVTSVELSWIEKQIEDLPDFDTIVGIGGGMAIDVAKYISWKLNKRLVSIPTILSVDAFTTPAAGVRNNHDVEYLGTATPNPLIIDYNILRTAPKELNIAGVGDLFSIHTASFDWTYANSKGKSEYPFSDKAIEGGEKILEFIYNNIGSIRENNNNGLRAIVEAYISLNTICLPLDHFRIEEGSEHYLFYELEERLKRPFIHGNIIGLGIYLLSRLQNNDPKFITQMMNDSGLVYHPYSMNIDKKDLVDSLLNLKKFVGSKEKLWFTVIDDSDINIEWINENLSGLKF
jgi:glycerol-1-phosphate dehydrogenase [NAD(P)+]|tara:strand:- start:2048 stop:3073 length:1026 start_codon:yes stop_codon:yes gene_type:complete